MLIKGTSVTIKYKKIEQLQKTYYTHNDLLKGFFDEATVLPIPDEAPEEIPRIIVKTKHEHSQLNISPIAATFEIKYSDGFEKDWDSCINYIKERMDIVFELLNIMTDNQYEYIGVVNNILEDNVEDNGAQILADNLLKIGKVDNLFDLEVKYTFVEDEKFYVNIMLQNARLFMNGIDTNVSGALSGKNQLAESIGIIIDINDRFGFNTIPDYHANCRQLQLLLDKMSDVMNNKLVTLMNKGEY